MKQIQAYQCLDGSVEVDIERAIAWNLVHIARQNSTGRGDPINFSTALWIVKHKQLVIEQLNQ